MLLIFYTNAFPQVSTDSSVDRALGIRMKAQGFEPAPRCRKEWEEMAENQQKFEWKFFNFKEPID
jgi:hypothetical protein